MNDVLKHNLLAIAGSLLVSAILIGVFSTEMGFGEFVVSSTFLAIFFFVAYVYGRSYLIDAPTIERYAAQEKLSLFICFSASTVMIQLFVRSEKSEFGWPSQFSGYVALVIAGLVAWGSYRVAKRAIIQQYLAKLDEAGSSTKELREKNENPIQSVPECKGKDNSSTF